MIITNVNIYTNKCRFESGSLIIKDDLIDKGIRGELGASLDEEILDGEGGYLIPGMIDMHLHGAIGYDFGDGTLEAFRRITEYELRAGITSICPATMTLKKEDLMAKLKQISVFSDNQNDNESSIVGINMEGPFISVEKCGAQDSEAVIPCDVKLFYDFVRASKGMVKVIGFAPEMNDKNTGKEFINAASRVATVALAHTNADYDEAKQAIEEGASHVVHLFNAMPEFSHRSPGVVGAASDSDTVTVELISDGVHIHPSMLRSAFKLFGPDRIILISDSMQGTGLEDGEYELGGKAVIKNGHRAVLKDNEAVLAGSVTNLAECLKILVNEVGIRLEDAVKTVTVNPAKRLLVYDKLGSIERGKYADLVIVNDKTEPIHVIKRGRLIY